MSSYRPIDSKREEFRKYLERTGVMDALTKVLVLLYEQPDKPEDALEFMRSNLGDKRPSANEIENMRTELEDAHHTIKELDKQLQLAKAAVAHAKNQLAAAQTSSKKGKEVVTDEADADSEEN
ncbi:c-Myc-binding protein-like isoform X1 [Rhodnius prolixus]|uniref:Putative c-myc-binding protein n=2 Tax=Rhodnius TaxID=13248 RepID=A0A0P4VN62_9HEMI